MTLRTKAVDAILSKLQELRYRAPRDYMDLEFGNALGRISMAHLAELIDIDEAGRLYDLALNASIYAHRDARQREASHA